jgi:DNA-binding MarR family transcriptional regulator
MKRPHGTGGVIRRWILTKAGDGGVTTAELRDQFDLLLSTAASHLQKCRQLGYIEPEDVEANALRCTLTPAGREYLERNGSALAKYDDGPLRAAMGMR